MYLYMSYGEIEVRGIRVLRVGVIGAVEMYHSPRQKKLYVVGEMGMGVLDVRSRVITQYNATAAAKPRCSLS